MRKSIKLLIVVFLLLIIFPFSKERRIKAATEWDTENNVTLKNDEFTYYAYLSGDGLSSWIYKIEPNTNKTITTLVIPKTIQGALVTAIGFKELDGDDIDFMNNIFGISIEPYHQLDGYSQMPKGIKKVELPSTLKTISRGTFSGFQDLKSITIPDGVEELKYWTFYNCISLGEVILPASLTKFDYRAFEECKSLSKIDIGDNSSNFNILKGMLLTRDNTKLVWVQPRIEQITIPSGVKTIGLGATMYSYVKKIDIPSTVNLIENKSFNGSYITEINISSRNTHYAKSQNCIYSKKSRRLVVAICKNGTITLPKEVKYLKNNVSIAGGNIRKLIIPETFKGFKQYWYLNSKFDDTSFEIYFKSSIPPKAEKESFKPFSIYYVPNKSLQMYQKWYYDTEEIVDESNVYIDIKKY